MTTTASAAACARLRRRLKAFPRVPLAHLPTPLEPMDRLGAHLGGPRLWVKRDDCTGLSGGGNKARKLEFLMGKALESGADCVITHGATQSNHARQTAAAAARLGLSCYLLLEDRTGYTDPAYRSGGNVLLDRLHGAILEHRPGGTDMAAEMEDLAGRLRAGGRRPFVIPGGGSGPTGALGYVNCAVELVTQADRMGLEIDLLLHATGSSSTQAGLLAGLEAIGAGIDLLGIGVRFPRDRQETMVHDLACRTLAHLGAGSEVPRGRVRVDDSHIGPGYGLPTDASCEAVRLLARLEGLVADPVYSGKAMAGLVELAGRGRLAGVRNVVFLHTGGSIGLFAHPGLF